MKAADAFDGYDTAGAQQVDGLSDWVDVARGWKMLGLGRSLKRG
jgi:hypothetical protein